MTMKVVLQGKGSQVETIAAGESLLTAVRKLRDKRIGALVVIESGERIVGIISERDVITCLGGEGPSVLDWPVSRAMTAPAITASPADDVIDGLSLMTRRRIRHLPVVEDGKIRGIVSIGDLVKYRIERIEAERDAMRNYIQTA